MNKVNYFAAVVDRTGEPDFDYEFVYSEKNDEEFLNSLIHRLDPPKDSTIGIFKLLDRYKVKSRLEKVTDNSVESKPVVPDKPIKVVSIDNIQSLSPRLKKMANAILDVKTADPRAVSRALLVRVDTASRYIRELVDLINYSVSTHKLPRSFYTSRNELYQTLVELSKSYHFN